WAVSLGPGYARVPRRTRRSSAVRDHLSDGGFNHQAFVLEFSRGGESLYPRLDEVLAADPQGLGRRVRVELYRRFGYFPTESSEHSAEYVQWFMRHDSEVSDYRIFVGDYLARCEENLAELDELTRLLDSGAQVPPEPADELASQFIRALETGAEQELYVNIRNDGRISNLPADAC